MKTQHLHDVWSSPDNGRLVSKQFSFRLPVHIAAKIAALGEMYPQKNRTQIVADLISAALDDLERNLPYTTHLAPEREQQSERDAARHFKYDYEPVYEMGGVRAQYRNIVNKYYRELEQELGNDKPVDIYKEIRGTEKYIKES